MSSQPPYQFNVGEDGVARIGEPPPRQQPAPEPGPHRNRQRTKVIAAILFACTCVSTFFAGMYTGNLNGALGVLLPLASFWQNTGQLAFPIEKVQDGLVFAGCTLGILLSHEMGHFLLAKWHRIRATPPFFIPMPIGPFGTLGAVIFQDAHKADRRQLFDIAIAGPLAGLVVAVPVVCYGVATSQLVDIDPEVPYRYGNPLLVQWIVDIFHPNYGPSSDILINPALFAGWVGIFITALNLIPIGQLDGGHILYTMARGKAHLVAMGAILLGVSWMALTGRMDYALILLLLLIFGPIHAPTADDHVSLGTGRYVLGWLTLAFIIIGFTPTPIIMA